MPIVSTADFIRSSAGYIRANVSRANADKNSFLTKAEAQALPRDLKDNFENHRWGAQENQAVTAAKFVERFTNYVAVHAQRADVNGDGFLNSMEAKRLPVDLRDNFRNYAALR